jgi:hypothetical protein
MRALTGHANRLRRKRESGREKMVERPLVSQTGSMTGSRSYSCRGNVKSAGTASRRRLGLAAQFKEAICNLERI